ncbi:hypothetical protein FHR32_003513 [Streptosporangium album]|uniref:Uncharacterized protein n=1 Tax=Streptosporangium album TaxID=47479 RepID=A0A7W7W9S0_9ACTN|nr:hypothetical protein [Streptosporangium album]MBB4939208.1 hypothetical protein [Streptosporangium album]
MTHTEHDLRELLAERSEGGSGGAAHLEEILRRGRAVRRRRRAVRTALAVGAVAVAVTVPLSLLGSGGGRFTTTVAAEPTAPTVSRAPDLPRPGKDLPASVKVAPGQKMSLIEAYRSETTGAPYRLTFQPTSHYTGIRVACADPKSWVVIISGEGARRSSSVVDSCPSDVRPSRRDDSDRLAAQHNERSTPADWTRKEQTVTVWVLPSDAPVISMSDMSRKGCEVPGSKSSKCDGKYSMRALTDPKVVDRLTAELGTRPGRWAVGVYDRAAS